ncbi:hypothetical protein F4677DRAFT_205380 [Hypoxylon crocopeplum]|nr:hypothetical protein F4677DRAFT_205380 [Hypoxylon crocopeplum]
MMFKQYVFALLPVAFSLASASLVRANTPVSNAQCWNGTEIHDPCWGFETGCTVDGILVKCDGGVAMIYSSMCDCCENGPGICTYDANCNASCG